MVAPRDRSCSFDPPTHPTQSPLVLVNSNIYLDMDYQIPDRVFDLHQHGAVALANAANPTTGNMSSLRIVGQRVAESLSTIRARDEPPANPPPTAPHADKAKEIFTVIAGDVSAVFHNTRFWADVGIVVGALVSVFILCLVGKWSTVNVSQASHIKTSSSKSFCWLFIFIGGIVLMPTLALVVPLLLAHAVLELYHRARGTDCPSAGWVLNASGWFLDSWGRLGIRIFECRTSRRAEVAEVRRVVVTEEGRRDSFVDVELNDFSAPAPPYKRYAT